MRSLEPGRCQSSASTMTLRSNTSEGATGMAKPFGQINKYWYGLNSSQLIVYHNRGR
jgi:hypothetical protein